MSRIDKLNKELRHHISVIVQQSLNDPSVGFVTIISASISPDLQHLKVFFTCLDDDDEKKKKVLRKLNRAAGFVRKLLSERLTIRFIPDIKFIYDDTIQQAERIEKIFEQINKEETTDESR